jgi:FAD binding domain-containing protein
VQNGAIVSVESLGGRELQSYYQNINEGVEDLSPVPRIFVTQIGLEPVLRQAAAARGARLRYSCEVVSLDPDEEGVTAVLRDRAGGEESTVRARYVVAADGVRSSVRSQLGVGMQGHGSFSDSITIYFRGDVRALLGERNLSVVYAFGPRLQGFFRFAIDGKSGFLVVNSAVDGSGQRTTTVGAGATGQRCVQYVREALGDPELPVSSGRIRTNRAGRPASGPRTSACGATARRCPLSTSRGRTCCCWPGRKGRAGCRPAGRPAPGSASASTPSR